MRSLILAFAFVCSGCAGERAAPGLSSEDQALLSTLGSHYLSPCEEGMAAFETTVHPFVRENCAGCHENEGGPAIGPSFAVEQVKKSYSRIRRLTNFADVDGSRFVEHGGNQHCATYGIECGITHEKVREVVMAWWEAGEKSCRAGQVFTEPAPLPANLPYAVDGAYVPMRWPLDSLGTEFIGSVFEIEVQKFIDASEQGKGAYRFRRPRLLAAAQPLDIRTVRVLVNDKFDVAATVFEQIDQRVGAAPIPASGEPPHPLLSSKPLLVIDDQGQASDQIVISFERLSLAEAAPSCAAFDEFEANVYPVMVARNCSGCHGGGNAGSPDPAAVARFDMNLDLPALCAAAVQRIDFHSAGTSVLIDFALRGVHGHPKVIPVVAEVVPAWTDWVESERKAQRPVTFAEHIVPLVENCMPCHSQAVETSGLTLETYPFKHKVMTEQKEIVERMIKRLEDPFDPMPPSGNLGAPVVDMVRLWMKDGLQP